MDECPTSKVEVARLASHLLVLAVEDSYDRLYYLVHWLVWDPMEHPEAHSVDHMMTLASLADQSLD